MVVGVGILSLTVAGCGGGASASKDAAPDLAVVLDSGDLGPVVTVSAPSIDFGTVVQGTSSSAPSVLTVTNRGAATSLVPAVTGPFAIASSTCTTLAAGGTCTIGLKFNPDVLGQAYGILTVAPGISVTLVGTCVAPAAYSMNDKVDLGSIVVGATVSGTITVSALTVVDGLSCTTSGAEITADANSPCPTVLAAGATCTFGFNFKATTTGQKTDSVVCNATGVTRSTVITAMAVTSAKLAFQTPTTVAVGTSVNTTGSPIVFSLVNSGGSGSGALTLTPGGDTDQFLIDNQCIVPLGPSAFCKITVAFRPTSSGQKTLTLTVVDANAPTNPAVATVNGAASRPGSVTIVGDGDFGSVSVGASSSPAKTFTIENPGLTDTGVLTVEVSDTQFVKTADGCSNLSLAAGKSCTISLVFRPVFAGTVGANLGAFATGAAIATQPLTGVGVGAAALVLAPATLDFGGIVVNTISAPNTFTIINQGQSETGALEVVKTEGSSGVGGASQFSSSTTCQGSLPPNGTCAVVVTFAPLLVGSASAAITVRTVDRTLSSGPGTLLGLGVATADLTLSCGNGFADTLVGVTSPTVTCTLTNSATTASGAIAATASGDFAIVTDNCKSANLQNNSSCTLALAFTPTAKGLRTGVVTVTSVNAGSTNQELKGTGLGIVEIVEATTVVSNHPVALAQPFDFGQVTVGTTSPTSLTLAVYVRAPIGTLTVRSDFGSPAEFALGSIGGLGVDCNSAFATTAPTPNLTDPVCYMVVNFVPQARAAQTGSITVSGANGKSDSASIQGMGTGPITISPSPATFSTVAQGKSSDIVFLTIRNNGTVDIRGLTLTLAGSDQFLVVSDELTGSELTALTGKKTIGVRFIPTAAGAANANLTVSGTLANSSNVETQAVSLVGNGTAGVAMTVTIGNNGVFADTPVGATSAPLTVTVRNAAGSPATGAVTFSLAGTEFTTTPPSGIPQGTCTQAASNPVVGGAGCTELVWFKPSLRAALNSRTSILTVTANPGGSVRVPVSGTALSQLTITPNGSAAAPIEIGPALVNVVPAPSASFTLTNNAETEIPAGGLTIAVASSTNRPSLPSLFVLDSTSANTCTGILGKSGGTCTFTVSTIAADIAKLGAYFGQVQVTVKANPLQKAMVDLKTTVVAPAALTFTPSTDFSATRDIGTVALNASSAPIQYTVVNTGGANSSAISVSLYATGSAGSTSALAKPGQFAVDASACTSLGDTGLAPGHTCDVLVTANPTSAAPSDANQAIAADLSVKAGTGTHGLPGNELRRTLRAEATSAQASPYLVDDSTGFAPADLGVSAGSTAVTKTVALYNPGPADYVLPPSLPSALVVAGASTGATIHDDMALVEGGTCAANGHLVGGAKCTLVVRWSFTGAVSPGWRTSTLTLNGTPPASMVLFARVAEPAVLVTSRPAFDSAASAIASPALDFGQALLSGQSQQETVVITNMGELSTTGNVAVTVGTSLPNTGLIYTSGCTDAPLAALGSPLGNSCTLTVFVVPQIAGAANGTVALAAPGVVSSGTGFIGLSWFGVAEAQLGSTTAKADFGAQAVLSSTSSAKTTQTITITNGQFSRKTGPLALSILDRTGAIVPDFGIAQDTSLSTCLAKGTLDVSPDGTGGDSCTVQIQFTPTTLTPSAKEGILTVTATPGGTASIELVGTAVAALSVTGPAEVATALDGSKSLTVASTSSSSPSGTRVTVTFTNESHAPQTGLLSATLSGADASQFRVTDDGCTGTQVPGGGSCTVALSFVPKTVGAKTATIAVGGSPGDSAALVLIGTATP